MDLQVTNHRITLGLETESLANGQKRGIARLTGINAKIQKTLGLAEDITLEGKVFTINKKSRNKWFARTTTNFTKVDLGRHSTGQFSEDHKIINQAIKDCGMSTTEVITNHVLAKTSTKPISYQGDNLTSQKVTTLFKDEQSYRFQVEDREKHLEAREEHLQAIRESATNSNARTIDTSHIEKKDKDRLETVKQEIKTVKLEITAARKALVLARFKEAGNKVRVLGQVAAAFKAAGAERGATQIAKKQPNSLAKKTCTVSGAAVEAGTAKRPATLAKTSRARLAAAETKLISAKSTLEAAKTKFHVIKNSKATLAEVVTGKLKQEAKKALSEIGLAELEVTKAKTVVTANSQAWSGISGADIVSGKAKSPQAALTEIQTHFKRAADEVKAKPFEERAEQIRAEGKSYDILT